MPKTSPLPVLTFPKPVPGIVPDTVIALEVKHLSKFFRKNADGTTLFKRKTTNFRAVDDISFHVQRGEIYGILGPNGSGKSTLIRAISTLLVPDQGEVIIFGLDLKRDEGKISQPLNRVSVDATFDKKLSPRENLLYCERASASIHLRPRRVRSRSSKSSG